MMTEIQYFCLCCYKYGGNLSTSDDWILVENTPQRKELPPIINIHISFAYIKYFDVIFIIRARVLLSDIKRETKLVCLLRNNFQYRCCISRENRDKSFVKIPHVFYHVFKTLTNNSQGKHTGNHSRSSTFIPDKMLTLHNGTCTLYRVLSYFSLIVFYAL